MRRNFYIPEVPIDLWERSPSEVRSPSSFEELKAAVQNCLHPGTAWRQVAIRLWLGRQTSDMSMDQPLIAHTLLQIEALSALLLAYRVRQLTLPVEDQDRSRLTAERLGIAPRSLLYHSARRALAPITVIVSVEGTGTSHALLNGTAEHYTAGRRLDSDRPIYESRFEYGVLDTNETREIKRQAFWHTGSDGKLYPVTNDRAPHGAKPWTCQPYEVGKSLKRIEEWGAERCVAFTVLYDENKRVIAQHRRLFRRFHELDLDLNPAITMDLSDDILTLRSDVFVWGVFLGWHDNSDLPDNAFDMLPGIPYSIPWDEAVHRSPKIRFTGNSLFSSPPRKH